ncbi:MAG: UDP-N-acetylmuramate dehydrogenase [Spirochaetaceae bacterium]|nr:UDP-N-acetylmuramate dehydrogenase [Spirochaetaceae bacterium]
MHKKLPESSDIFNIQGQMLTSEPMWRHTTFRVGGPADYFAIPKGEEDLRRLLTSARSADVPVFVLGDGSNLLVADEGIRGVVIDMHRFSEYRLEGDLLVSGAGLEVSDVAWESGTQGYAGLDYFYGMPGSVGGAVWMNARCYGGEIADILSWVEVMNFDGKVERIPMKKEDWDYKISPFQSGSLVILRAAFRIESRDSASLRAAMKERRDDREKKGHYRAPCAGSAFKNNRDFGSPSGVLIDSCGLKGRRSGGAAVSNWHGNILINDRGAKARDILALMEEVAREVERSTGFHMEKEVLAVGDWEADDGGR